MKTNIKITQRITLITTGIFLLLLVISIFVIWPSVRYITRITADINRTSSEMEEQYQKIRLLKKSIRELDTIREKTAVFGQANITKGDELSVIHDLEDLAQDTHVNQNMTVKFLERGKDVKRDKYVFDFKTRGELNNLLQYLEALEHLPYYILIDQVRFEKPQKQADDGTQELLLSFSAIVYSN